MRPIDSFTGQAATRPTVCRSGNPEWEPLLRADSIPFRDIGDNCLLLATRNQEDYAL